MCSAEYWWWWRAKPTMSVLPAMCILWRHQHIRNTVNTDSTMNTTIMLVCARQQARCVQGVRALILPLCVAWAHNHHLPTHNVEPRPETHARKASIAAVYSIAKYSIGCEDRACQGPAENAAAQNGAT